MEDEAAKEDFEALDDIEDIEAPGEGGAEVGHNVTPTAGGESKSLCLLYTSPSPRDRG